MQFFNNFFLNNLKFSDKNRTNFKPIIVRNIRTLGKCTIFIHHMNAKVEQNAEITDASRQKRKKV